MEKATFGAGCFWGVEPPFQEVKGVTATRVGYSGGTLNHPIMIRARIAPGVPKWWKWNLIRRRFRTMSCSVSSGTTTTQPN